MGVHDSVSVVGFIGFLSLQLPLYQFHFKKETYFQLLRKEAHNSNYTAAEDFISLLWCYSTFLPFIYVGFQL